MNKAAAKIDQITHKPVLLKESVEYLRPMEDGIYVDATVGLGSHTRLMLERSNYKSRIIALDVDEEALAITRQRLSQFKNQVQLVNKNFSDIDSAVLDFGIEEVDGILADLGMSSYQLEHSKRGFSFLNSEPLDMRMDPHLQSTAFDLLNEMTEEEINGVLRDYGEERFSKRISKSIVNTRKDKPLQTSYELAALISDSIPRKFHPKKIHPATKSFQALRIAVNNELENLKIFIEKSVRLLKSGGRLVIISFHSLEDRIVKNYFKKFNTSCICPPDLPVCRCNKVRMLKILTKSPVKPGHDEILENPRSRSSKMRVGERI
ncbi:MAG: 16S rRNA (cytosine(1402)-N(4))-methyltransferase RsmH [Thermodesulfobacteriota bacterium]